MTSPRGYAENAHRPPTVSVVVTTWRRPEQLRLCLEAIKRQIYAPFEVVVTEDEDCDNTIEQLFASLRFFNALHVDHPRTLDANGEGIWNEPLTVNMGVAACAGDIVLVLQDDCILPPDFLLWLIRLIDPSTILYPVLEYTTHDRFTVADLDAMTRLTHLPDAEPRWQALSNNGRQFNTEFPLWGMAEGLVWAFYRSIWLPLDEHFIGSGYGEQDWALRQRLRGKHLAINPLLRAWLRDWPGVVHPTEQDTRSQVAAKLYMEEKWGKDVWEISPSLPALPWANVQERVQDVRRQFGG